MNFISDKPIRFSTWHFYDPVKKRKWVLDEVMVAGEHKHIPVMAETQYYVKLLYKKAFSKAIWRKEYQKNRLKITRIILHEQTFGNGVGRLDKEVMIKYGFEV